MHRIAYSISYPFSILPIGRSHQLSYQLNERITNHVGHLLSIHVAHLQLPAMQGTYLTSRNILVKISGILSSQESVICDYTQAAKVLTLLAPTYLYEEPYFINSAERANQEISYSSCILTSPGLPLAVAFSLQQLCWIYKSKLSRHESHNQPCLARRCYVLARIFLVALARKYLEGLIEGLPA